MPKCSGIKEDGTRCGAWAIQGTEHCIAHSPAELQARVGFGGIENSRKGGHGRHKPIPVAQQLVEDNIAVILEPYFRTLGCQIVEDEDGMRLERSPGGGAKLYGTEQKSGEIRVSDHDDLGAMQAAAEKLFDRIYGRPKQQTEVSGPNGGPVTVAAVDLSRLDVEEKRELLKLVEKASEE